MRSVLKWVAFAVPLLLAVVLQVMVFPRLPLPAPPAAVAAAVPVAMFTGTYGGGAAGLICGLLCDALLPSAEGFFALTLMAAGAATGFLCEKVLQKTLWTALSLTAGFAFAAEFLLFFLFYFLPGRAGGDAVYRIVLPAAALCPACTPLFYPVCRGIAKRL